MRLGTSLRQRLTRMHTALRQESQLWCNAHILLVTACGLPLTTKQTAGACRQLQAVHHPRKGRSTYAFTIYRILTSFPRPGRGTQYQITNNFTPTQPFASLPCYINLLSTTDPSPYIDLPSLTLLIRSPAAAVAAAPSAQPQPAARRARRRPRASTAGPARSRRGAVPPAGLEALLDCLGRGLGLLHVLHVLDLDLGPPGTPRRVCGSVCGRKQRLESEGSSMGVAAGNRGGEGVEVRGDGSGQRRPRDQQAQPQQALRNSHPQLSGALLPVPLPAGTASS